MTTEHNENTIVWSIGVIPVQSWISQATRSRDLRFSSLYLSHVIARAVDSILNISGAEVDVLLPRTANGSGRTDARLSEFSSPLSQLLKTAANFRYSLPNRATGTLRGVSLDDAEKFFSTIEENCLEKAWSQLTTEITTAKKLEPACKDKALRLQLAAAINASKQPLRLVWCLKETELETGSAVSDALNIGKETYSVVKRARPVVSTIGAPVGKCRTCGEREAMLPQPTDNQWADWRAFQSKLAEDPNIASGLRFNAEPMCGVCAAKRLGGYLGEGAFPSTASIASANWRKAAEEHAPEELSRLEAAIRKLSGFERKTADLAPLYYEREVQKLRQLQDSEDDVQRVRAVETAQQAVYTALGYILGKEKPLPPSSYLIALVFDADDMGKNLGVDPLETAKNVDAFVNNLENVLSDFNATDFYIGGDEGLLLAPVESAQTLPQAIRKEWGQHFKKKPTLSVGVCVFDFGKPLGRALQSTHEAIAIAKVQNNKNALSVTVHMSSGSQWNVVSSWDNSWDHISVAQTAVCSGQLATGWPYAVQQMIRGLNTESITVNPAQRAAVKQEIQRITLRSQTSNTLDSHRFWERELNGNEWFGELENLDTQDLINQLQLIAFLARESHTMQTTQGGS